ncbi:TIGR03758 family integrating conjugative element protein [Pseudomonas vanderleydeniana]|uniref:TIGR03758 family integrating conjugative element protein n=1 Tax=Pseudomonas vanderleydeniana TaxID=2745495 RepID=A0A9E6PRL5_9PSED|nr:TIGR03758 family integrating conjugative element protein [Pseudomonas vanderleydeniana]QXI31187.1 TIGR03758 family integrating conjugative element protein [Pseudomonas vanderleydeniana]
MSMSQSQRTAFEAIGGFTVSQSTQLLSGLVLAVALVFAGWAILSGYRGWAAGHLSQGRFFSLFIKVALIYILLTALVLH